MREVLVTQIRGLPQEDVVQDVFETPGLRIFYVGIGVSKCNKADIENIARCMAEGKYEVSYVPAEHEEKTGPDWVSFSPTPEEPNVIEHVIRGAERKGEEATRIDISGFRRRDIDSREKFVLCFR